MWGKTGLLTASPNDSRRGLLQMSNDTRSTIILTGTTLYSTGLLRIITCA